MKHLQQAPMYIEGPSNIKLATDFSNVLLNFHPSRHTKYVFRNGTNYFLSSEKNRQV